MKQVVAECLQRVFRFGPFNIGRARYVGIDTDSILRAKTPLVPGILVPGIAFATKFRYRSVRHRDRYPARLTSLSVRVTMSGANRHRDRYLRSIVHPGIETKPDVVCLLSKAGDRMCTPLYVHLCSSPSNTCDSEDVDGQAAV